MPEVIASCYVESIDSNLLLVKDLYEPSTHLLAIIGDAIYCRNAIYYRNLYRTHVTNPIELVKSAMESGLVSTQSNLYPCSLSYYIYLNNKEIELFWIGTEEKTIKKFVNENRDLFERDGRPILK